MKAPYANQLEVNTPLVVKIPQIHRICYSNIEVIGNIWENPELLKSLEEE